MSNSCNLKGNKKIILSIAMMSYLVTAIDNSIIITGLTKIAADLNLNQTTLSWVQNAYILAFGGLLLLGGKLSDVFGRKKILNIALALMCIVSILCGITENSTIMIIARFFQGIGASMLAPTSMALLIDYFKGKERTKAIAWYSSVSGLGSCIGLVLGGFFASYLTWRIGFLINVPITLLMIFLGAKSLDNSTSSRIFSNKNFDILGTIFSIIGIFTFIYSIDGADNPLTFFFISLLSLVMFIFIEKRVSAPIMPLSLFKNKIRRNAYILRAIFVGAMMGFWFFISEFMQEVFHYSPLITGIAFFPMTISTFITAIYIPYIVSKIGNQKTLLCGSITLFMGFTGLLFLNEYSNYWINIAMPMLFLGLAQGFCLSSLTNLGIQGTNKTESGAASGLVNASHQIGGSLGLSLMVTISATASGFTSIFHVAMIVGSILSIFMLIISISLLNTSNETSTISVNN